MLFTLLVAWPAAPQAASPETLAAARFKRAQDALVDKRFADAARDFSAVADDPHARDDVRATAQFNVAVFHEMRGDARRAELAYRAFIERYPDHAFRVRATDVLARLLERRGDLREAAELLASLRTLLRSADVNVTPSDVVPRSMVNAGLLYWVVGDRAAAREQLRAYVTSYPQADDVVEVALKAAELAGPEGARGAAARARAFASVVQMVRKGDEGLWAEAQLGNGRAQLEAGWVTRARTTLGRIVETHAASGPSARGDSPFGLGWRGSRSFDQLRLARAAAAAQLLLAGLELADVRKQRARLTIGSLDQNKPAFNRLQSAVASCRRAYENVLDMGSLEASLLAIAGHIECSLELTELLEMPIANTPVEAALLRGMQALHQNEATGDGATALVDLAVRLAPERFPLPPVGSNREPQGRFPIAFIRHCWRVDATGDRFDACAKPPR